MKEQRQRTSVEEAKASFQTTVAFVHLVSELGILEKIGQEKAYQSVQKRQGLETAVFTVLTYVHDPDLSFDALARNNGRANASTMQKAYFRGLKAMWEAAPFEVQQEFPKEEVLQAKAYSRKTRKGYKESAATKALKKEAQRLRLNKKQELQADLNANAIFIAGKNTGIEDKITDANIAEGIRNVHVEERLLLGNKPYRYKSEETRRRVQEAGRNKVLSEEAKKRIKISNSGKKRTKEHRENISEGVRAFWARRKQQENGLNGEKEENLVYSANLIEEEYIS